MAMKRSPDYWAMVPLEPCRAYARRVIENYVAGLAPRSHALGSVMYGRQKKPAVEDVSIQTIGRACEVAFCRVNNVSETALFWEPMPDAGYDVEVNGFKYDVKGTTHGRRFLIFPKSKFDRGLHERLQADRFALCRIEKCDIERDDEALVSLRGIIDVKEFFGRCHIADDGHPLSTGTPYLHEDELYLPRELERMTQP